MAVVTSLVLVPNSYGGWSNYIHSEIPIMSPSAHSKCSWCQNFYIVFLVLNDTETRFEIFGVCCDVMHLI